jgi:murein DD-endopeptidase MepM/ murein hydrolase activator NlpD
VAQEDSQMKHKLQRLFRRYNRPSTYIKALATISLLVMFKMTAPSLKQTTASLFLAKAQTDTTVEEPQDLQYGFDFMKYKVLRYKIKSGDVFGTILQDQGIDGAHIQRIIEQCTGQFDPTKLRSGREITLLFDPTTMLPQQFIYEPNPYEYVVIALDGSAKVSITKRDVVTETSVASGVLETTFWQALTANGLSDDLADAMIDVLSYSVDFHHYSDGDRFKVIYEKYTVDGRQVGTGKIISAMYERDGKLFHAFRVEDADGKANYYDFEGRPQKRAYLKAPVKFSRISSRFSNSRFHPILRYNRPHHGTDFSAPHGAPIFAVADGTVEEAERRGGNGNYVKIKHDKTYASQYLHMSKFAKGIRPGKHVTQGEVIGYVGSTGLATGPHVCFRFWKNGQQVDFLKQSLPSPDPIVGDDLVRFKVARDSMMEKLDSVPYKELETITKENSEILTAKKVKA